MRWLPVWVLLLASCDKPEPPAGPPKPTWTGKVAKDVACGGNVVVESAAHKIVHDGHEFLFCSEACHAQFKANPKGHATGLTGAACGCPKDKKCGCGHCSSKPERCACADPK